MVRVPLVDPQGAQTEDLAAISTEAVKNSLEAWAEEVLIPTVAVETRAAVVAVEAAEAFPVDAAVVVDRLLRAVGPASQGRLAVTPKIDPRILAGARICY